MKLTFTLITSILLAFIDINDIATINALKRSAEEAFLDGNYEQAAVDYSMLIDSLQIVDDRALLNLGHAYFQLSDSTNARSAYQQLAVTDDRELKSIAYQQLGMLNSSPEQLEKSLHFFKESVKANPANEEARYNYELVKKKLQEQEKQNQDQQDEDKQEQDDQEKEEQQKNEEQQQDQQNEEQQENQEQQQDQQNQEDQEQQENQEQEQQQDQENSEEQQQQNQEQQEGEQEQSEEQQPQEGEEQEQQEQEEQPMPSPSEKLEEMNLSEEKARMILEAMRNSEVQYLQQMKKKATKKADSKKPDW